MPLSGFDDLFDGCDSRTSPARIVAAGGADPTVLSALDTVKAIMYTAPCRFGGVLCGAVCPVVFMSRSDSTETRLRSLAFALAMLD